MDNTKQQFCQLNSTHPSLTGNIKLVVDSNGETFLSSIKSSGFLDKINYTHFRINKNLSLEQNYSQFLNQETMSDESELFSNKNLDLFKANININTNFLFKEKYSCFAPFYINKKCKLPDYFIIFKNNNDRHFFTTKSVTQALNKSMIYKSFRLTDVQPLVPGGEILSNIFSDDFISKTPESLFYRDLKKSSYVYFNGIVYEKGVIGSEFKIIDSDKNIDFDILNGVKLISANHFNLEFLFDYDGDVSDLSFGYFYKDTLFTDIDIDLDVEKQSLFFDTNISKNNYAILSEEKFKINTDRVCIKNNVEIDPVSTHFMYCLNTLDGIYNISSVVNNTIFINSKTVNYSKLYSIQNTIKTHSSKIKSHYNNIKLTLLDEMFKESDFIEINVNGLKSQRFRLYASNKLCCNSPYEFCFNQSVDYIFESKEVIVEKMTNCNVIKVRCEGIIPVDITTFINTSCDLFSSKDIEVKAVDYNYNELTTDIIFFDYDNNFYDIFNIGGVKFFYTTPEYYYTYFDNECHEIVQAMNIAQSFKRFKSQIIEIKNNNNELIFKNKKTGESFGSVNVSFDSSRRVADFTKFLINNKFYNQEKVTNHVGDLSYYKNHITFSFGGYSNTDDEACIVSRNWVEENLSGDEVIACEKGYKKLQKFTINNKSEFISNYVGADFKFNNNDDVCVLTVDNDKISLDDNLNVLFCKLFTPTISRISKSLVENI